MVWKIEFSDDARKQLKKIAPSETKRILKFLRQRIEPSENPKSIGKTLRSNLSEFWRYRVGNYRIVCEIQEKEITVLVVRVGHRSSIYK